MHGTVHVFHNCAAHSCKLTKTKSVMQERHVSAEKTYDVVHTRPDDVILNLAQLTNASRLVMFRPDERYPNLSEAEVLEGAVAQRAQLNAAVEQKKLEKTQRKQKRDTTKQNKRTGSIPAKAGETPRPGVSNTMVATEAMGPPAQSRGPGKMTNKTAVFRD